MNLYAYVGNNSVMFVDLMGLEKNLIKYMLGDEYIEKLRKEGSIAGIDAIFIEAKRLSSNDIDLASEWFATALMGTSNYQLELRQPLMLGDLEGRDKVRHFATAFNLTYNYNISPTITDGLGVLWEMKDIFEPLLNSGVGYDQSDIDADRFGIEFARVLKRDNTVIPSDILNNNVPETYFEKIEFIPSVY
ncbi:MAG: hypothetical protein GY828_00590 [Candidatus Gracilibacteria bacterium]|nr:hypothetical protein [Candidatus Gracilibacteria bacterium]